MNSVLPLVGGGDDVDLIRQIERAFGVALDADALRQCATVGDLHQLLLRSVPAEERSSAGCLSAKAFFLIKRAAERRQPSMVVRPRTELRAVVVGLQISRWLHLLGRDLGLQMPVLTVGPWGLLWVAEIAVAVFCAALLGSMIAPIIVGVLAISLWLLNKFARFPEHLVTVGDLAKAVAALNTAALGSPTAVLRKRDIWPTLQQIIRNQLSWNGPVELGTYFFKPRAK